MSSGDHPLKADLLLVLATLVAAAGWIFSKEALAGMPPLQFVGVRFLLAGVVLAALGWNQLRALDRAGLRGSLLVGTLFAVAMAFWIKGLEHARHLGEGAFISSLGIVLVPLIGRLFFGDRPPRLTWVAMPVALGGFACLSLEHGFRFEPGQWFFIAAAVVFAILLNLNSRVVRNVSPLALSAIQVSMVGGLMLPLSALTESWPDAVSTPVLGWLLASALIATTLRFFVQLYGQSLTTPSHAAVILMLEPMWTAIVAAWWFGERMTTLQFVGCGLIFAALVLSRWPWIRALLRTALK
ncbi:MAG: DMT family transporter [Thauera propionica]|uniref:EamA family transporter n=1 Tax=Thauera propionica TaxID=2019431 RepID=A0A235EWZ3_9RHOO|nr:DMT family transporter [Thauera propionica]MDY0046496.1 DMT family transporter [Thauera propionica]OYD53524.1 EamA family transporter [Thauera propionica]